MNNEKSQTIELDIQNSFLEAVGIISEEIAKRTNNKALELACIVGEQKDYATGEYIVKFQDSKMNAYALHREAYEPGDEVYILIPEGDFSKTKYIVGYVNYKKENNNITFSWLEDAQEVQIFRGSEYLGFLTLGEQIEDIVVDIGKEVDKTKPLPFTVYYEG